MSSINICLNIYQKPTEPHQNTQKFFKTDLKLPFRHSETYLCLLCHRLKYRETSRNDFEPLWNPLRYLKTLETSPNALKLLVTLRSPFYAPRLHSTEAPWNHLKPAEIHRSVLKPFRNFPEALVDLPNTQVNHPEIHLNVLKCLKSFREVYRVFRDPKDYH